MLAATSGSDRTVQRNVHERSDDERSITHAFIRCQVRMGCCRVVRVPRVGVGCSERRTACPCDACCIRIPVQAGRRVHSDANANRLSAMRRRHAADLLLLGPHEPDCARDSVRRERVRWHHVGAVHCPVWTTQAGNRPRGYRSAASVFQPARSQYSGHVFDSDECMRRCDLHGNFASQGQSGRDIGLDGDKPGLRPLHSGVLDERRRRAGLHYDRVCKSSRRFDVRAKHCDDGCTESQPRRCTYKRDVD